MTETRLYRFGSPDQTDSIRHQPQPEKSWNSSVNLQYYQTFNQTNFSLSLNPESSIYGLGQNIGPINRRGATYRLFNMQARPQTPDCRAVNGPYAFSIIKNKNSCQGILIDCPAEINFDCGFTKPDLLSICIESLDFDLYLIEGIDVKDILKEYTSLTGKSYLPPKWAFGFQQSRYSYMNAKEVQEIAQNFRSRQIPCDAIYLDIDYMEDYKVFTVDPEPFPNFANFTKEIQGQGFHLIPIIDPGVKIESGYSVYEEGVSKGYFCKNAEGQDYIAAVWPSLIHFPDFLRAEVREWWGNLYKFFTDLGISAFWNDMNEPEIFYSPDSIQQLKKRVTELDYTAWRDLDPIHYKINLDRFMLNSETFYPDFFHQTPTGLVPHQELHNLYGFKMLQAASEGLQKLNPNQRYFLISRSSMLGVNRLAGVWTGDNSSWWEHLKLNIQMVISLNLCGVLYSGSDIGGHCGNADEELLIRWTQLGAFLPLFRNHTEKSSRRQEPWAYSSTATEIIKDVITLRYALIDYLYSEFLKAREQNLPFIRPVFLEFAEAGLDEINDQFLCGASLMIAPVIEPNARHRTIILPEFNWLYWCASKHDQYNFQVLAPGIHRLLVALNQIPIFIKENHLILLTEPEQFQGEKIKSEAIIIGLINQESSFTFYYDDGVTINSEIQKIKFKVSLKNKILEIEQQLLPITAKPPYQNFNFMIYDLAGNQYYKQISLSLT